MRLPLSFLLAAGALLPARASLGRGPTLAILGQLDDGPIRPGAVHARRGQRITLHLTVRIGTRWYSDAPELRLGARRIRPPRLQPLAALGLERIGWSAVEPHPHHVKLPPPNPDNRAYSNAILFGPNHGRWRGYDRIEYHETPLPSETGGSLRLHRVTPSNPKVNVHDGLGSMRYKVTVSLGDRSYSTPGEEATGPRGISPAVALVSFREADDLVGWLTAYFNVPNVFGSGGDGASHQTELFQGADCADVIIGALRLAGSRVAYTSVLGLKGYTRPVSERLLLDETGVYQLAEGGGRGERVRLRFGDQIRRGDIMLIDYVGFTDSPRGWDHVAVIARDGGKKDELDPEDPVLHMGYLYGLTEAPARSEGPAIVQFLRLKPQLLRSRSAARAR